MSTAVVTANIFKGLDRAGATLALAEVLAHDPDLGGLQEWGPHRDHILDDAKRYDSARAPEGGGPVFWRRDRYGLVRSCRAVELAPRSFVGKILGRKSTLPESLATLAILCDDETGREVAVINFHLTAEVQSGGVYRSDRDHARRVRRHRRERRHLMRLVRRQCRKGRTVYALGDTNYDAMTLPPLTSCWEDRDGGTLGKRAVDVIYADESAKTVRTFDTGSDHRAVIATY